MVNPGDIGSVHSGFSPARAEGALVALAAGDALGWPQEFPTKLRGSKLQPTPELRAWQRRSGSRFAPYDEDIRAGTYTDDTQLMLAVARSLLNGETRWWAAFTRTELPLWSIYKIGGGRGTKRAARSWIGGTPPWLGRDDVSVRQYFEHGGNGVAMRVLPHAIMRAGEADPRPLMREVVLDGLVTHGHPRALVGAALYALAAWWQLRAGESVKVGELVEFLLDQRQAWGGQASSTDLPDGWLALANRSHGGRYGQAWTDTVEEVIRLLARAIAGIAAGAAEDLALLQSLGACGPEKGSGTVATVAAIYLCSKYEGEPSRAIVAAAFAAGADTDTVAAMVGGLAGGHAGLARLPDGWLGVQDCDYLRKVARSLAAGPVRPGNREAAPNRSLGKRELDAVLEKVYEGPGVDFDLDGDRRARVVQPLTLIDRSRSTVTTGWEVGTSDGQTLYVTRQRRRRD